MYTVVARTIAQASRTKPTPSQLTTPSSSSSYYAAPFSAASSAAPDAAANKENPRSSSTTTSAIYGSPEWKKEVLSEALAAQLTDSPRAKQWDGKYLTEAVERRGASLASSGLFPLGPEKEMVHAWMEAAARNSSAWARAEEGPVAGTKSITAKLGLMLRHRLEASATLGHSLLQDGFTHSLTPETLPRTLEITGQMVDEFWILAGDKATDYNWYTKRGLLSFVYIASELHMMGDSSPGYKDTFDFLDRRLKDVGTIGRDLGQTVGALLNAFYSVYGALQAFAPAQAALSQVVQAVMVQLANASGNAPKPPTAPPGTRPTSPPSSSASSN